MLARIIFSFFALCFLAIPSFAQGEKVILATGEWPPYVGASLEEQGATAEVVRAAFEAVGVEVEVRFFPWSRTIYETKNNPHLIGYFPEYPHPIRERQYYFSDSVGKSPLGFAKRKDHLIQWLSYLDLKKYTFATVRDYANAAHFDRMVAQGEVLVDESVSDLFVLRKVLANRVDYGVIDSNVFDYLLESDKHLSEQRGDIQMDPHLLDVLNLFVCFKRSSKGKRMLDLFNEGLEKIRPMQIQRDYIQRLK